jgi:hypothetical protein
MWPSVTQDPSGRHANWAIPDPHKKKKPSVVLVRKRTIPTGRRMLKKLVPTIADRGCRVVCATDPHDRILGFLDRSRYFLQVAPQLYSRGWVDPVPDPLLLRKSGSAGNLTRNLWICSQELWPIHHRGGHQKKKNNKNNNPYPVISKLTKWDGVGVSSRLKYAGYSVRIWAVASATMTDVCMVFLDPSRCYLVHETTDSVQIIS